MSVIIQCTLCHTRRIYDERQRSPQQCKQWKKNFR